MLLAGSTPPGSEGPVGPTNVSDARVVFAHRQVKVGILTRDRWIGRRLKWHLEWKKPDCWIGVFWRNHMAEDYGFKYVYAREIWVCLLPCLPLCITTYWWDARPRRHDMRWHRWAIYRRLRDDGMGRLCAAWVTATFAHDHGGEG